MTKTSLLQIMKKAALLLAAALLCQISRAETSTPDARLGAAPVVKNLRCEYLKNPLGIDVVNPRLSWMMESGERGQKQTAYQILVASTPEILAKDQGDLWDSGKVASDQSHVIPYAGKPMQSEMPCFWKVMVWDREGTASPWSEAAMWSMGLLEPEAWQAKWIGLDSHPVDKDADSGEKRKTRSPKEMSKEEWHEYITAEIKECELPARYVRREFEIRGKVKRATAYVSGLGFYDLFVNGREVEDECMQPGLTLYDKRVFYVTHDLTSDLQQGRNAIGVILGNGRFWSPRRFTPAEYYHGGTPRLLFQMHIEYEDGTREKVLSDASWQVTDKGPIRLNNEYDGESYDARMEMDGWSTPGFLLRAESGATAGQVNASAWQPADLMSAPGGRMQAQMIEPMRVVQEIKPVSVKPVKDGYIVDMGQSFYGNVRIKVKGPAGTRIHMTSAYSLDEDGSLRVRDNREAICTDTYVLKGQGEETWAPRFKGQGFGRVWVRGWPGLPTVDNFVGQVISMDLPESGTFSCSDSLINRIYLNNRWTQRMYLRSVPMDPDRDERQGWTGDQNQNVLSYSYSWDIFPFFRKWIEDIRTDQLPNGTLPAVSPTFWKFYPKGHIWPSGITLIPEILHQQYGDPRVISESYDVAHKWMTHLQNKRLDKNGIYHEGDWGDWQEVSVNIGKGVQTPIPLLETAYFYHHCRLMEKTAVRINRPEDARHYRELGEQTKAAFLKAYFDPKTAVYAKGAQTSYAVAIMFDLVPETHRERVIQNFVDSIVKTADGHPSVGMVGMQWMFQALDKIGRNDVALQMLQKKDFPSWGYMISKGATSIWEKWNSDTAGPGMNSEGLLFLGGNINAWLFECLAGLRPDPVSPGFKRIIIKPNPVGNLTWVNARYQSIYGSIVSNWKREGGKISMDVTVPPNTTATVFVPAKDATSVTESGKPAGEAEGVKFLRMENDRAVYEVDSGNYEFRCGL
jgi:alpha-L-rhamnosidase